MAYDHNLPAVLNPVGDYCVPLFIPLHPDYTALLLGVLRTLEEVSNYERDPNFDDENAQIVATQWRERTLTPLVEAIATAQACGGYMNAQLLSTVQINWSFSTSSFVASGAPIAYTPTKANALIKMHIAMSIGSGNTGTAELRYNGNVGATNKPAVMVGSTLREMVASGIWTGLTVGVAHNIELWGKASAGQLNIQNNLAYHLVEVLEYD